MCADPRQRWTPARGAMAGTPLVSSWSLQTDYKSFWIAELACGCWAAAGALPIRTKRRTPTSWSRIITGITSRGFRFLRRCTDEKNHFHFYSFRSKYLGRDSLKQVFETQMALPYFPVNMSAMNAKRKFQEVDGGDRFLIGKNKVTARWLNHPQGCLGFRIETTAGTVVYATDNEPGDAKLEKSLRELAAGADIFINDAQFTPEQWRRRRKAGDTHRGRKAWMWRETRARRRSCFSTMIRIPPTARWIRSPAASAR